MANNPKIEVEIGANIEGLKVALTQAEKNLERANGIFAKASKNVFALENEVSKLSKQYKQGTISEKDFAKQSEILNAKLLTQRDNVRATGQEIARLNAIIQAQKASNLAAPIDQLNKSTKGFTTNVRGANSVAIEFNRIIQDSPFGLIGIGNNIQQLAGNFSNLTKNAGGTGAAVKAALSAMISPANLALLGISALTAGFTAYQMGAFDGIFATRDLAKELDKFKESLSSVDSARLKGIGNADKELITLNSLKGIIESETTSRKAKLDAVKQLQDIYPAYFGNLTQEQILAGDLAKTYEALTKTIIAKAQAEASVSKFIELAEEERLILKKTADERSRIAQFESKALQNQIDGQKELQTINENQVRFLTDKIQPELNRINEIKEEQKTIESDITSNLIEANAVLTVQKIKVDDINKSFDETIAKVEFINQIQADSSKKFTELAKGLKADGETPIVDVPIDINFIPEGFNNELGLIQQLQTQIQSINALRDVATDPARLQAYNEQLKLLQAQLGVLNGVQDGVKLKVEDLAQAFTGLGAVIGKAFNNPQFGTFLGQFAQFVTKIVAGAFAVSKANAVAGATQSSLFTGPAAVFTLPAFIAGAVGLVASAFSGIGGGGGGRGSAGGAGTSGISQGTSFTGQGGGSTGFNRELNLRGEFRIDGTDLVYVVDQARASQI